MQSDESDWVFVPSPDDEDQKEGSDPYPEWSSLFEDSEEVGREASGIIEKFYWREAESGPELLVVFREENSPLYKYLDVPLSKFNDMKDRLENSDEYQKPLEKWFLRNISEKYEFERFSDN